MSKKLLIIFILCILLLQGCSQGNDNTKEIRIAEQYGIAYAPVQIMRHQELIEKHVPGIKVIWEQMANTAAIREAMVADKLDVGFMAIPPFLIGWDKGMDWKIFSGLSYVPVGLVTENNITSLDDIKEEDRIALPQPGSVQHILLSMASEKLFNDTHRFDNSLVTLSHPDGMNAILSGKEIKGHFTSTPYLQNEISNDGYHQILDGKEAFGEEFSFIVGVTTKSLHENNEVYVGLNKALEESIEFIENNPEEAAKILKEYYDLNEEDILSYLTLEDTDYNSMVKGTKRFAEFMKENEYISKVYENNKDIMWDNVKVYNEN